ncbi:UDP-D-xylose:L-fucose alpha-1,3-D-xylosyltransferase MGP4 [Momordica charantia]|uniref:Glycosyltransferase n=1 Tax=Momordica charantia TaxID=3673 RepID=A0A6J1D0C3_MOMCH|nr:UDP-D-xylose:L-fucose alpha-1,3-D-xylosyltransferase MGP4 [Momordica charantia]XP_022147208.1 UDP-D-xylose:L-fucose alpha-1,3-D-xylosyltransferase MGP4 [Momordica charantia]XP_022147209.1 UDP-D-xylose:L-fucose alpha-1,3-D-xylosyltransferase MGP4 [Momordica charantia]
MPSILHQRPIHNSLASPYPLSPRSSLSSERPFSIFSPLNLLALLSLIVLLGVFLPWMNIQESIFSTSKLSSTKWQEYSLAEAASFVARNGTVIVCAVSQPYLPFLNNWLISVTRQKHHEKVLVIAEDYATLYKVNERWPGHAVLVPPAPDAQTAHKFGSQGFFNFTSRRPRHLLHILELGYNVMYNDVDMVWLADPFPYLQGNHDVYFTDDMAAVKSLHHSHDLPPPGKKGRTYICSCMIFLRPTNGAKLVMRKWIEELKAQPWSKTKKSNDQPAFNWALDKTAGEVDLYLLPQPAFPTGGLYFKNQSWVKETKGMHVIIHNNYITGFEKKIKRFREFDLWYVDDHTLESPLGRI